MDDCWIGHFLLTDALEKVCMSLNFMKRAVLKTKAKVNRLKV